MGNTRLSLTLPNGITITFETDAVADPRELLSFAFKELPPGLMRAPENASGAAEPTNTQPSKVKVAQADGNTDQLVEFCRGLAPLGDMRRIVAIAEGARRFRGVMQVSPLELGTLFDEVGWPRPKDFVQALRNAGRRRFGWLARVPGKQGYYTPTEEGVKEVVGKQEA